MNLLIIIIGSSLAFVAYPLLFAYGYKWKISDKVFNIIYLCEAILFLISTKMIDVNTIWLGIISTALVALAWYYPCDIWVKKITSKKQEPEKWAKPLFPGISVLLAIFIVVQALNR